MTDYLPMSVFQCQRKKRYETEEDAKRGETEARRRGAEWIRVYRCRYCCGYHLGHVTNWKSMKSLARQRGLVR